MPTIQVESAQAKNGILLIDLLTMTKLVGSKGKAKRLIQGCGARVNGNVVLDCTMCLSDEDAQDGVIKLLAGRKRHAIVQVR